MTELIGQDSQERTIRLSGQNYLETASIMDVQGVPLSTTSCVNVLAVYQSIACSMDVQGVKC